MGNLKACKADVAAYQPDALIFIDYPGFNLRIADWAKKEGIPTHYYISPQIWAWKQSRIHQIKRNVDHMYVILPFEKDFYAKFDYEVHFVGHPLIDAIQQAEEEKPAFPVFADKYGLNAEKPVIALLPGSRKQEIKTMLPIMLSVRDEYPGFQFVVAGAPSQDDAFYQEVIGNYKGVSVVSGNTYGLLRQSTAALVTSGTATLETALFNVPEVVCYKGSYISYLIARNLIKVKFISLVNLIMDRELVRELIQGELTTKNLKTELDLLLKDLAKQAALSTGYEELKEKLGGGGASAKTAELVLKTLTS
jgi:lipid-A-disaccharide synthase